MTTFTAEPETFANPQEVFEFAASRLGQPIRIERDSTQDAENLPVFGWRLADVIQSTRYFDQTEEAVIYFQNGGSAIINADAIAQEVRIFGVVPPPTVHDLISSGIHEGFTFAAPQITTAIWEGGRRG